MGNSFKLPSYQQGGWGSDLNNYLVQLQSKVVSLEKKINSNSSEDDTARIVKYAGTGLTKTGMEYKVDNNNNPSEDSFSSIQAYWQATLNGNSSSSLWSSGNPSLSYKRNNLVGSSSRCVLLALEYNVTNKQGSLAAYGHSSTADYYNNVDKLRLGTYVQFPTSDGANWKFVLNPSLCTISTGEKYHLMVNPAYSIDMNNNSWPSYVPSKYSVYWEGINYNGDTSATTDKYMTVSSDAHYNIKTISSSDIKVYYIKDYNSTAKDVNMYKTEINSNTLNSDLKYEKTTENDVAKYTHYCLRYYITISGDIIIVRESFQGDEFFNTQSHWQNNNIFQNYVFPSDSIGSSVEQDYAWIGVKEYARYAHYYTSESNTDIFYDVAVVMTNTDGRLYTASYGTTGANLVPWEDFGIKQTETTSPAASNEISLHFYPLLESNTTVVVNTKAANCLTGDLSKLPLMVLGNHVIYEPIILGSTNDKKSNAGIIVYPSKNIRTEKNGTTEFVKDTRNTTSDENCDLQILGNIHSNLVLVNDNGSDDNESDRGIYLEGKTGSSVTTSSLTTKSLVVQQEKTSSETNDTPTALFSVDSDAMSYQTSGSHVLIPSITYSGAFTVTPRQLICKFSHTDEPSTASFIEASSTSLTVQSTGLTVTGNTVITGTTTIGDIVITGTNSTISGIKDLSIAGTLTFTSDARYKNFQSLYNDDALNTINSLDIYRYNYLNSSDVKIGITAQQLQQYVPELVHTTVDNQYDDKLVIEETKLVYVCMQAIKQLSQKLNELEQKIGG